MQDARTISESGGSRRQANQRGGLLGSRMLLCRHGHHPLSSTVATATVSVTGRRKAVREAAAT